ncbi:DUF1501 domain-containing protein [Nocardioides fonticola]|uniref:DUF1501 domain-containing protein n=1 Tax=Nocardioides fonticola TaxID=450363 RepID=A0ABP7XHJ6_9ACTN
MSADPTPTGCGCPEGNLLTSAATVADGGLSRRGVLRGALLGGTALTVGSAVVTAAPIAAAATQSAPWTLVVLSMRGAADGLSLVVPHGDPVYYSARPRVAIPKDRLLVADAMFGLHPALAPLQSMWQQGKLAAVHAAGLPAPNRSHFAAIEAVEDAAPGSSTRSGWLNRLLGTDAYTSPLQGVAVGTSPFALAAGAQPSLTVASVNAVRVAGASAVSTSDPRIASLARAWDADDLMGRGLRTAVTAVADYGAVRAAKDTTSSYPATSLGRALALVSRSIRADVGSSVVTVDHGNWDMHTDLGTVAGGWMTNQAGQFAAAVSAFFADLGSWASRVTLVTVSEFGRRTVENADHGLDHGWGSVMFLAGAGVNGGRYYGRWPGLTATGDADLPVTTDYRSVLAEVIGTRTSASLATVFPGFTPQAVGVMRR